MGKRDSDLDAEIERKLWQDIRKVEQAATANVAKLVESTTPWMERTVGDVSSLEVYRGAVGLRKARESVQAVINNFNVVAIPNRIDNEARWEAASKEVEDGKEVFEIEGIAEPEPAA